MIAAALPFIFILTIIFFIVYSLYKSTKGYKSLSTFDEYKENHPKLVSNGKVSCSSCGGRDIFVRKIGHTPTKILNIHMCRSCGKSLYRSTTGV
jgi:hypothetical protein